ARTRDTPRLPTVARADVGSVRHSGRMDRSCSVFSTWIWTSSSKVWCISHLIRSAATRLSARRCRSGRCFRSCVKDAVWIDLSQASLSSTITNCSHSGGPRSKPGSLSLRLGRLPPKGPRSRAADIPRSSLDPTRWLRGSDADRVPHRMGAQLPEGDGRAEQQRAWRVEHDRAGPNDDPGGCRGPALRVQGSVAGGQESQAP